jgi:hypothetical protein
LWKQTDKWRPGRTGTASGGFGVQCGDTSDLGYAKPRDVWQEKVAYDIASLIGVPVPEIRLGEVEGKPGTHAVSVAFGSESNDLRKVRETSGITDELKNALARASGLLALHAWLGTGDLKDEHVLVSADDRGNYRVAAIDFASAFGWDISGGNISAPTTEPKGLVENVDKAAVEDTVRRIEALSDEEILQKVAAIPESVLPAAERQRVADGLIKRRGSIRAAMNSRGWLV